MDGGQGLEKVWVGAEVRLRPGWWQSQVRRGWILGYGKAVRQGGGWGRRQVSGRRHFPLPCAAGQAIAQVCCSGPNGGGRPLGAGHRALSSPLSPKLQAQQERWLRALTQVR